MHASPLILPAFSFRLSSISLPYPHPTKHSPPDAAPDHASMTRSTRTFNVPLSASAFGICASGFAAPFLSSPYAGTRMHCSQSCASSAPYSAPIALFSRPHSRPHRHPILLSLLPPPSMRVTPLALARLHYPGHLYAISTSNMSLSHGRSAHTLPRENARRGLRARHFPRSHCPRPVPSHELIVI